MYFIRFGFLNSIEFRSLVSLHTISVESINQTVEMVGLFVRYIRMTATFQCYHGIFMKNESNIELFYSIRAFISPMEWFIPCSKFVFEINRSFSRINATNLKLLLKLIFLMWVARFSLSLIWNARIDFHFNEIVLKSLEIMWHIICDRHVLWIAFDTRKEFAYHAIESNFSPKTITYFHKTMIEHDRKKHVKYILLIRFFLI